LNCVKIARDTADDILNAIRPAKAGDFMGLEIESFKAMKEVVTELFSKRGGNGEDLAVLCFLAF